MVWTDYFTPRRKAFSKILHVNAVIALRWFRIHWRIKALVVWGRIVFHFLHILHYVDQYIRSSGFVNAHSGHNVLYIRVRTCGAPATETQSKRKKSRLERSSSTKKKEKKEEKKKKNVKANVK